MKKWLGLAFVVAIVLAAFWLTAGETPTPPSGSSSGPEVASNPPPTPPIVVAAIPPAMGGAAPPPPDDPVTAYRKQTRYSPGSGRLHPRAVDLLEPNRRYETPRKVESTLDRGADGVVTVQLDADRYYYTGDEIVTATLQVKEGERVLPVQIQRAVAIAEGASGAEGEPEPLQFRLQDGEPTADLDLSEVFPEHHGPIQIVTEFAWEPGASEEAKLRIFTTPTGGVPAEFTGRDQDRVENGSLVIEVGVEVLRAGFYRFDANLFSQAGEPLAFSSFKGELEAGAQRVPLEFFGLLLHDLAVRGPYELRNLRGYLFREAEYPDRLRMRDATHTHWTRSYDLASFSDEEFESEHKTRMIELLEADVAAGIAVPIPGGTDL